MSFPGPCPVSLEELLRSLPEFHHLSIVRIPDGRYQASYRPLGADGYKVAIEADIVDAALEAMSPAYGHTWSEVLRDDDFDDIL